FTTPTIAGLAAALPAGDAAVVSAPAPGIPVLPRGGPLPLSLAQQRLWFLHEFDPDGTEYLTPTALRLRGQLDAEALRTALTGLVARHEALRTTFESTDGQPYLVIHPPYQVQLPVTDLSGQPAADRDATLTAALAGESTRPFDLQCGPLLRTRLIRLAGDDHALAITMPHIITAGWSTGVLRNELGALYTAAVTGQPADLPPLPVQYADYAAWQRDRHAGTDLDGQLGYWRDRLAGAPALELPT